MRAVDVALGIYQIQDVKRSINRPNDHDLYALLRLKGRRTPGISQSNTVTNVNI